MTRAQRVKINEDFLASVWVETNSVPQVSGSRIKEIAGETGAGNAHVLLKALIDMEILQSIKKGSYKWKSTAEPNNVMANELENMRARIVEGYSNNRKKIEKVVSKRNLVSLEKVKEEAETQAMEKLVRAQAAANILGVNLFDLPQEKIKKFVSSI